MCDYEESGMEAMGSLFLNHLTLFLSRCFVPLKFTAWRGFISTHGNIDDDLQSRIILRWDETYKLNLSSNKPCIQQTF